MRNGQKVIEAVITPKCLRKYKLMEDNSVLLSFSSDECVNIEVGDTIHDEVFGYFFSAIKQYPKYNASTGGYDYNLTFVSHEMMWKNYKFMLSVTKNDGTYGRKETSWKLTSSLKGHMIQIRQNLMSLGLYNDVVICMSNDIEKKDESKYISYDSDNIISGLKKICDEYECEWWTAYTRQGIHIEYMTLDEEFEGVYHKGTYFRSPAHDRLGGVGSGVFVQSHNFKAYRNDKNDFTYISEKDGGQYYPVVDGERTIFERRTTIRPVNSADYTYNGNYDSGSIIGVTMYELEGTDGSFLYTSDKVLTSQSGLYRRRSVGIGQTYSYSKFVVLENILISRIDRRTLADDATLCLFVGKCENWDGAELVTLEDNVSIWTPTDTAPLTFEEGVNVESMSLAKDQTDYANRLYVFGGTQNIPSAYRKKLSLKVDKASTISVGGNDILLYEDTLHEIKSKMASAKNSLPSQIATIGYVDENQIQQDSTTFPRPADRYASNLSGSFTMNREFEVSLEYDFNVHLQVKAYNQRHEQVRPTFMSFCCCLRLYISKNGSDVKTLLNQKNYTFNNYSSGMLDNYIRVKGTEKITLDQGTYNVSLVMESPTDDWYYQNLQISVNEDGQSVGWQAMDVFNSSHAYYMRVTAFGCDTEANSATAKYDTYDSFFLNIIYNGQKYLVLFNPEERSISSPEAKMFAFVSKSGSTFTYTSAPSGFGIGSNFEPLVTGINTDDSYPYGLSIVDVPLSYYSGEYDSPFSLLTIGESRLCLPLEDYPNGYMGENLPIHSVVEKIVCFDNVYPRCVLVVTNVTSASKKFKTEYEDGSIIKTAYSEYHIEVKNINGSEFPFKSSYQSQGTLKMDFVNMSALTDDEKRSMSEDAHISSLAGMQFECNFGTLSGGSKEGFLLIINDNYGTNLPNDVIKPEIGDICVLSNWDVRAMLSLGLIENAEQMLKMKGLEYADELEQDQVTATCQMMSDDLIREEWYDSHGERMVEGEYIYLKGTGENYSLPLEGVKVRLMNGSLKFGEKTSRILGYEMKLDIPYDTPTYIVGETEAYSRLKQIEKQINKLS